MTTPPTLRAEVRALAPDRCLITTPTGRSLTVEAAASTVLRMLDAWSTGYAPDPASGLGIRRRIPPGGVGARRSVLAGRPHRPAARDRTGL